MVHAESRPKGDARRRAASGSRGFRRRSLDSDPRNLRTRYDRPRGPVAAVLLHYNGFYAGSAWAFFGLEKRDLFATPNGPEADLLKATRSLPDSQGYLHTWKPTRGFIVTMKPVRVSVVAENGLERDRRLSVRFDLHRGDEPKPIATEVRMADVPAGGVRHSRLFPGFDRSGDLYRVVAKPGVKVSKRSTRWSPDWSWRKQKRVAAGPQLRFATTTSPFAAARVSLRHRHLTVASTTRRARTRGPGRRSCGGQRHRAESL